MRRCVVWRTTGSPPRAWGQCLQPAPQAPSRRFTPTGVGTMMCSSYCTISASVHPHGRGDNYVPGSASGALYGSPPRAWGQFVRRANNTEIRRFTPTGVGTISCTRAITMSPPVHPHGRGDNFGAREVQMPRDGSPPRAWGQSLNYELLIGSHRFTPTGVGTICRSSPKSTAPPGSPPRAWGQFAAEPRNEFR